MTQALQEIILKVEQLPEQEQNQIAILIEDELLWNSQFENSKAQLSILAKEALDEYKKIKK